MSLAPSLPNQEAEVPKADDLLTREKFADGVLMKVQSASALPRSDKFKVYRAVEQATKAGRNVDDVLAAVGMTRQVYFTYVWFTDDQALAFEKKLQEDALKEQAPDTPKESHKKKWNDETKMDAVDRIRKARYVENVFLDEACKSVGISVQKFYKWDAQYSLMRLRIMRRKARLERRNAPKPIREKPLRLSEEQIDGITLETRRKMIDEIHAEVRKGKDLNKAIHAKGILKRNYHNWAAELDVEEKKVTNVTELWKQIQAAGDQGADLRARFIEHYRGSAERKAKRMAEIAWQHGGTLDEASLVSAGLYEGVALSIDKFDPSRGSQIGTFMSTRMTQRMLDELRKQEWAPRLEHQMHRAFRDMENEFFLQTGRIPRNTEELRAHFHVDDKEALVTKIPVQVSLDKELSVSDNGRPTTLQDLIPHEDSANHAEMMQKSELVQQVLAQCTHEEKILLTEYYLEGKTLAEVGAGLDLSESRMSQMMTATLKRIRETVSLIPYMPKIVSVSKKIINRNKQPNGAVLA